MPSKNITIDNSNPAIIYSNDWKEGDVRLDSLGSRYSNGGTFKLTTEADATARFTFNGTAVWVFGARRPNHGNYSISLDGAFISQQSGAGPDIIPDVLYSATSLPQGPHTVEVKNIPLGVNRPYLDIDFITYQTNVGAADEAPDVAVIQDTADQFSYTPSQAWTTSSEMLQSFNGSTGHLTTQGTASVSCNFTGDAISVWGSIGPQNGPYLVSLDGAPGIIYNATYASYTPQVQLYEANNLGPGLHTLVLTNRPDLVGQALAVDFAIVTNTVATKTAPNIVYDVKPERSSLSTGAIIGIACGAAVIVVLICVSAFILVRKRRKTKHSRGEKPNLFEPGINPRPFVPQTAAPASEEALLLHPPHTSSTLYQSTLASDISPTTARTLQSPRSQATLEDGTTLHSDSQKSSYSGAIHAINPSVGYAGSNAISPIGSISTYPNEKMRLSTPSSGIRMLPQPPVTPSATGNLSERLIEPGRETDAGPLPPSYTQATQPL